LSFSRSRPVSSMRKSCLNSCVVRRGIPPSNWRRKGRGWATLVWCWTYISHLVDHSIPPYTLGEHQPYTPLGEDRAGTFEALSCHGSDGNAGIPKLSASYTDLVKGALLQYLHVVCVSSLVQEKYMIYIGKVTVLISSLDIYSSVNTRKSISQAARRYKKYVAA
jgi:hypothetical protein